MDLLPNEEIIAFQKVGFHGQVRTSYARISDLEKVDREAFVEEGT